MATPGNRDSGGLLPRAVGGLGKVGSAQAPCGEPWSQVTQRHSIERPEVMATSSGRGAQQCPQRVMGSRRVRARSLMSGWTELGPSLLLLCPPALGPHSLLWGEAWGCCEPFLPPTPPHPFPSCLCPSRPSAPRLLCQAASQDLPPLDRGCSP